MQALLTGSFSQFSDEEGLLSKSPSTPWLFLSGSIPSSLPTADLIRISSVIYEARQSFDKYLLSAYSVPWDLEQRWTRSQHSCSPGAHLPAGAQ